MTNIDYDYEEFCELCFIGEVVHELIIADSEGLKRFLVCGKCKQENFNFEGKLK